MSDTPIILALTLPDGSAPRLDKALAAAVPEDVTLSRSRLQALIAQGAVSRGGDVCTDPRTRVAPGEVWQVTLPPSREGTVEAEDIALTVVFEDAHLIVIDKPAGMVVHPAPGAATGTLVHALLHHCGDSLSGIGGARRPGIVHRIDKDTSGLLVVAKTDAAHQGLAVQFAAHTVERRYAAVVWGAPSAADPRLMGLAGVSAAGPAIRISAPIARHRTDRKRMAVVASGRHAVTHITVREVFGNGPRPAASLIECRLETGRTHQIRVHLAHVGHPLVGDPVYGHARAVAAKALHDPARAALSGFARQALHAMTLGFTHPVTGELLQFLSELPRDINTLLGALRSDAQWRDTGGRP